MCTRRQQQQEQKQKQKQTEAFLEFMINISIFDVVAILTILYIFDLNDEVKH
jgi:hypothetical protein